VLSLIAWRVQDCERNAKQFSDEGVGGFIPSVAFEAKVIAQNSPCPFGDISVAIGS
jgi:hypothetical protein